jgi:hypothetical protein
MLAADLPTEVLTGPDDPVAQVADGDLGISDAPFQADARTHNLPTPTSTDVDAWFETESSDELTPPVKPARVINTNEVDQLFGEVDHLLVDASDGLPDGLDSDESDLSASAVSPAEDNPQDPVAQSTATASQSNWVADFSWPAAVVSAEVADEATAQQPGEQSVTTSLNIHPSANLTSSPKLAPG